MAAVEAENIPLSELGAWLKNKHFERLQKIMNSHNYGHFLKKYRTPEDLREWYDGELTRLAEQLRENLETSKESFYRQEMLSFRNSFHKPVIYASWDWERTVADALHHAGFASYEEQAKALEAQRKRSDW